MWKLYLSLAFEVGSKRYHCILFSNCPSHRWPSFKHLYFTSHANMLPKKFTVLILKWNCFTHIFCQNFCESVHFHARFECLFKQTTLFLLEQCWIKDTIVEIYTGTLSLAVCQTNICERMGHSKELAEQSVILKYDVTIATGQFLEFLSYKIFCYQL